MLLYADDTIILAESHEDLSHSLALFEEYCNQWKLKINISKTKIIVFSKRKYRGILNFKIYGNNIDVQDSYCYLGVHFNYNCSFVNARKKLFDQANKALYSLYRKLRNTSIPIEIQLKLFDALILPILTYAAEIWGFENIKNLEKMHLQFCKRVLKLRISTPNYMVYGELGRYPIEIHVKLRMISFWNKLLCNENKLSSIMIGLCFNFTILAILSSNGFLT